MVPVDSGPREQIHELLLKAIHEKHVIQFLYQQQLRIAEPHDYGIQNKRTRLLCYQLRGQRSGPLPNWRWIEVPEIF